MTYDIDQHFAIFDHFLETHPHYKPEALRRDITHYFLPFTQKLIDAKERQGGTDALIVGISAIQGAGKTTQGEIFEILLQHFQYPSCSLSIDDHYVTHEDLVGLRNEDPRFVRRGVTHDISLAIEDLTRMKTMEDGQPILVAGYDKGAHRGDGDRFRWVTPVAGIKLEANVVEQQAIINQQPQKVKALRLASAAYNGRGLTLPDNMGADLPLLEGFLPAKLCAFLAAKQKVAIYPVQDAVVFEAADAKETVSKNELPKGWRLVNKKPAFIFYDGWMLGAFPVTDESIFDGDLPGLETEEARQWAKFINLRLALYGPLWNIIDFLSILYVPNYHMSLLWREQAEEALRAKGRGMNSQEIKEFVHYFWRSVHPAIHIKSLAHHPGTHQVVIIDDDRSIKEVLTPEAAKVKYA